MKTNWNYSELARHYVNRPEYSDTALNEVFKTVSGGVNDNLHVCDVGAGVAHLTIPLLKAGHVVDAVEPNDEMREIGAQRTKDYDNVTWFEGTGEKTGRQNSAYEAVTFGSSFNVTDRSQALIEAHRILKDKGWFVCMWNHRNLDDELQKAVEGIILKYIPNYNYGSRREDQTEVINQSGLFKNVTCLEGDVKHSVSKESWLDAWRSHATLHRQAGENFDSIIKDIEALLKDREDVLQIPYTTKIWIAQKA